MLDAEVTIVGFGSLLSKRSALLTTPSIQVAACKKNSCNFLRAVAEVMLLAADSPDVQNDWFGKIFPPQGSCSVLSLVYSLGVALKQELVRPQSPCRYCWQEGFRSLSEALYKHP